MSSGSRQNINFNRIYIIVIGIILFWIALEVRLFVIQVERHDFYERHSQLQSAKKIDLSAKRGTIYDRAGEQMATNLIHYDFGIDLQRVKNKRSIANKFSAVFKKSTDYYLRRMKSKSDFVYLERKVPESEMIRLNDINDPGFVKIKGFRRFYPYSKYASQLLGFTNIDDKGIAGLEMQFEDKLKGENGWTFLLADARRRFGYHVDLPQVLPEPGNDIILTIDKNIQTIIEDELDRGVKDYNANYGMAVLMDPTTGEVLAMASNPGFNLNSPETSTTAQRRNRAITDIFEPGSTFKVFPAAVLLQENLKKPNDIVFCENGSYKYYNHVVHDSKKYGWLSFNKVIELSSNIGMVKLSTDIPSKTFYRYLRNFGFDSETGINLIGEAGGMLAKPSQFSGLSKGVISFGQEIGVTAIQIITAFSAIVNGGELMHPYVIKKIISPDGSVILESEPRIIRRVISDEVAAILKEFMLDAVRRGTGKKVKTDEVLMGGKTGTAQKYNKETKRYKKGAYFSSFIGFAPYEEPRYVLGIFLDEPRPRYYGGDVAAPIFSNIMQRLLKFVPAQEHGPQASPKMVDKNTKVPDLRGLQYTAVAEFCEINDLPLLLKGEGTHVLSQKKTEDDIELILGKPDIYSSKIPNLKGKTIREALKLIDFSRLRVKISGTGTVIKQNHKPGTSISSNQILLITCSD